MYESSFTPLVSIIVPAYNAEKTISDTIASIVNQTYNKLEIIIVDDGSTDRTAEIVQSIAIKDHRIQLIKQQNAGVAQARNTAIRAATGSFIAPIDADDLWHPTKIQKQLDKIVQNRNIGLVYTWVRHIDENNNVIGSSKPFPFRGYVHSQHILKNVIGNGSSILTPAHIMREMGGYDPVLRDLRAEGAEDYKLQLKIAERYEFEVVPEYLTGYRKTRQSMSANSQAMYKSKELVLHEAEINNKHIPKCVFRWALASPQYSHGRALIQKNICLAGIGLIIKSMINDPIRALILFSGEIKKFYLLLKFYFASNRKREKLLIKFTHADPEFIPEKRYGMIDTLMEKRIYYARTIDLKKIKINERLNELNY
jgi:glycosyltransferase involved in cell wall biosynthesis